MRNYSNAGWFWLIDLVGAAWFAWGIAEAVSRSAAGLSDHYYAYAAIVGGGLMRAASVYAVQHFAIAKAQRGGGVLRARLFRRLLGMPLATAPSLGGSAVLAIDYVRTIEDYEARFVPARLAATLAPLAVIAIVACASLVAAAILFVTLIPFILGMIFAGTAARRASERQLAALGDLSGLFVDRVRTLPIIRHFGAEERIARQVQGATREVADRTVAVLRAAFLSSAVLEFFSALAVALVAVYCGFSLLGMLPFPDPETLTLREAFFALAMAPEFYLPMRRLAAAYHEKQMGEAAHAELAALPEPAPQPAAAPWAGLRAQALTIAWPGHAIGPLDFEIGATGLIALTGPTGSGKTSVLAAIAGQVQPASGQVTPVAPGDIAWAAQHPLILPGTLRDNLALAAPDAPDAAIAEAVGAVGLDQLTESRGIDLPLDHRGSGLSGGERRRLGLARAILSGRPLLLCDEPTADLDDAAARDVVTLLTILAANHAVIVATHDARLIAAAQGEVAL
ncbi:ATP-binding cassette domain-containing protein [Stakelama tenebrarum]|uniref:ATP-binding cassette domain-containing protein n=1 Tax=Stakelama tenebrarum TaxID=2711215 RepID=A0A6G6Y3L9_9SPHN|nr:ATP-binding cassette domain-containing protein [Sphingosinithalassobacter tenebrarum]QIG79407.1 ATP-binding cassette domain-containing protein [Sphingosinithalassobacter tenebrarum]